MSKKIVQPKGEGKIIELDAMLEYKNGQVYIKKMNTNEMPAIRGCKLNCVSKK